MTQEFKCFLCDDRDEKKLAVGWDKESLGFVYRNLKLCQKHKTELEQKLQIMPDVPPEPSFVPKPVDPGKDYTEREPGAEG